MFMTDYTYINWQCSHDVQLTSEIYVNIKSQILNFSACVPGLHTSGVYT